MPTLAGIVGRPLALMADLCRIRSPLQQQTDDLSPPSRGCLMKGCEAACLSRMDLGPGIEQQADDLGGVAERGRRMERLVLLWIPGNALYGSAASQKLPDRLRTGKTSSQMERSPAVAGDSLHERWIGVEQEVQPSQISQSRRFEDIECRHAAPQKIARDRLAGVERPHQRRNSLSVPRRRQRGMSFYCSGEFGRLPAPDHVENGRAHGIPLLFEILFRCALREDQTGASRVTTPPGREDCRKVRGENLRLGVCKAAMRRGGLVPD